MAFRFSQKTAYHILGILVVLSFPVFFSPQPVYSWNDLFSPPILREILGYVLIIITFYVNYFFLVTRFFFKKRYVLYFLSLARLLAIVAFSSPFALPDERFGTTPGAVIGEGSVFFTLGHHFFKFFLAVFFSLMLRMNERWEDEENRRLQSELSFLKAQINPHFIFNILNNIYSLAIQKSDKTAGAIVKLSDLMRYSFTETDKQFVPLQKGIGFISSYIDLQRLRIGETVRLEYKTDYEDGELKIVPLLLLPFIENAFKYGVSPEEPGEIIVRIGQSGKELSLYVENIIVNNTQGLRSTGIGIENTRKRLGLLYNNAHQLEIKKENNRFIVDLKIRT